jgi:diaminopimelate decarboxylase
VPGSLPGHLVATGMLAGPQGRRGLAIDDDGTCLDPARERWEGLAALGRPTEDVTIGNDTLSRKLHGTTERWAARVAGRLAVAR